MTLWNFPLEVVSPTGERYRPTRVLFPAWQTIEAQAEGERNYSRARDIVVKIIDREFDLARLDLARSPLFPHLPLALDSAELLPRIKADVPVDAVEVVDWMQEAAANQAILSARVAEYNRHSQVVARSGDPYIPGVSVQDVSIDKIPGYNVIGRSFSVRTPIGRFSIPDGQGLPFIGGDFLAWAGGIGKSGIQWIAEILKWLDLARTPITESIGFPSVMAIQAPNFFVQEPSSSASRVRVRMQIASDKDQPATLTFRSPTNYTSEIDIPATVSLARGTNELEFIIASYPSVPIAVTQISPRAGTVLRRYTAEAE